MNRDIAQIIEADWTWIDRRFVAQARVHVDGDGRIARIELPGDAAGATSRAATTNAAAERRPARAGAAAGRVERLAGRALLPGFVNAHSHAFQRALRGRAEQFGASAGSFWSWREHMYALVEELDEQRFAALTRALFDELLAAGVTSVGEFHYVHHLEAQRRDYCLDDVVIQAAREAGIRLVLLLCYYRTGGIGRPLEGGQRRFDTPGVDEFLAQAEKLARRLDPATQQLGLAPHSLRAVPPEDLIRLADAACADGRVLHMHVEEQPREIEECRAAYGVEPMRWLLDHVEIGPRFTAVHCTHTRPEHMDAFVARGGHVCMCPITEGNLGDGIGDAPRVLQRREALCIGSDSNLRIDMAEEVRWLEFVQRMRWQKRGVLLDEEGRTAPQLFHCASRNGALALGVEAGEIAVGNWADFCTIDLGHRAFDSIAPEGLMASFLLSASSAAVAETCVGGRWIVRR